jgi:hypothetical protein
MSMVKDYLSQMPEPIALRSLDIVMTPSSASQPFTNVMARFEGMNMDDGSSMTQPRTNAPHASTLFEDIQEIGGICSKKGIDFKMIWLDEDPHGRMPDFAGKRWNYLYGLLPEFHHEFWPNNERSIEISDA